MKLFKVNKLKSLLKNISSNDANIMNCVNVLESDAAKNYQVGGEVPIREVIDIYKRRYELNDNKNIKGFPELMKALYAENDKSVIIHSFCYGDETYLIFTNSKISELIGILKIPGHST